jgi:ribosome-associated protein
MSDELPSKTQRKKEMHELQALGAELVDLTEEQLASVELPERLREAVQAAQRITKHGARRRQLQYIGRIMRDVDPEPIRDRLSAWKAVSTADTARLHLVERWRDRLLRDEQAAQELASEYPDADLTRVRLLLRNAAREREAGQPPKSYRALFKLLNETIGAARN